MNNGVECYGFRCNLAVKDITIYNVNLPDTQESRNKLFNNFFSYLKDKKMLETSYNKRKYIIIYKEEVKNIFHCQVARKREVSINQFDNGDIIERKEEDYPYVNIFVDLVGQKIIIEVNSAVFDNVDTCKKVLQNVMRNYFKSIDVMVEIHPITEKRDFKNCFSGGKIKKVYFEMNIPNWGNAASAAKELAEDSKNMGAEKIIFSLLNKEGNIIYREEEMESFVQYVADGAGSWKVDGIDDSGDKFSVKSEEQKKKMMINITRDEINEKIDEILLLRLAEIFNMMEKNEGLKIDYDSRK